MTYTPKEQALDLLKILEDSDEDCISWGFTTIREDLKSIPDQE